MAYILHPLGLFSEAKGTPSFTSTATLPNRIASRFRSHCRREQAQRVSHRVIGTAPRLTESPLLGIVYKCARHHLRLHT